VRAVYDEFLKPLLLVALFAPPEELSAGVVLGAFYFYTLAHQSDFDVCWCKVNAKICFIAPSVQEKCIEEVMIDVKVSIE